jgi:hypothetical protein
MTNQIKIILAGVAVLVLVAIAGIYMAINYGSDHARKQERDAAGQAGVGEYFVTKDGIEPVIGWRFKKHDIVIENPPVQLPQRKAEAVAQRLFDAWEVRDGGK